MHPLLRASRGVHIECIWILNLGFYEECSQRPEFSCITFQFHYLWILEIQGQIGMLPLALCYQVLGLQFLFGSVRKNPKLTMAKMQMVNTILEVSHHTGCSVKIGISASVWSVEMLASIAHLAVSILMELTESLSRLVGVFFWKKECFFEVSGLYVSTTRTRNFSKSSKSSESLICFKEFKIIQNIKKN